MIYEYLGMMIKAKLEVAGGGYSKIRWIFVCKKDTLVHVYLLQKHVKIYITAFSYGDYYPPK